MSWPQRMQVCLILFGLTQPEGFGQVKFIFSTLSKHGEVRTTNCMLTSGMCMKHDECSNNFGSYILGCYYDPFPPHLLAGDLFHFGSGDISVAGCIKACGEAGFLLAGLR